MSRRTDVEPKYRRAPNRCQAGLPVLLLAALLGPGFAAGAAQGDPPFYDSVRLATGVLLRAKGSTARRPFGTPAVVNRKQMPLSVDLYLKPSGVIDANSPVVLRTAQRIRAKLPAYGKPGLRAADPRLLVEAVQSWTRENLVPALTEEYVSAGATDPRLAWPRASQIIRKGRADAWARTRVETALLRAMGVPARPCWFRGGPALQYWSQLLFSKEEQEKLGKDSKVRGAWCLAQETYPGETPAAWSLDSGDLALMQWMPAQELMVKQLHWEQAYYLPDEEEQAKQDLAGFRETGRLPPAARDRMRPPAPAAGSDKIEYLTLAACMVRVSTQGPLVDYLNVEMLVPYRAHLGSWGREWRPEIDVMEVRDQAVWTDRPERLRLRKTGPLDEWKSPPPALGVLHYLSFGIKKAGSVLTARVADRTLKGSLFQPGTLDPRTGCDIVVKFPKTGLPDRKAKTDDKGEFEIALTGEEAKGGVMRVEGGIGEKYDSRWDAVLVEEDAADTDVKIPENSE